MNSKMLTSLFTLCFVIFLSCSTPDSRIRKNQELFDSYPAEVQKNIRAGKVEVGYTEDMVRMALGDPNETAVNKTAEGEVHVWAYTKSTPGGGVSVGRSTRGRTSVGVGVSVGRPSQKKYAAIVEFRNGRVSKVTYFDN
jgi:outer membrane protein assembly factor BamE (lipoprotein component of BamABCDE complex)